LIQAGVGNKICIHGSFHTPSEFLGAGSVKLEFVAEKNGWDEIAETVGLK
jgi:hypothetical protein